MSDVDDQEEEEERIVKEPENKKNKKSGGKRTKTKGAGRKSRKMAWLEEDREAVAEQAR